MERFQNVLTNFQLILFIILCVLTFYIAGGSTKMYINDLEYHCGGNRLCHRRTYNYTDGEVIELKCERNTSECGNLKYSANDHLLAVVNNSEYEISSPCLSMKVRLISGLENVKVTCNGISVFLEEQKNKERPGLRINDKYFNLHQNKSHQDYYYKYFLNETLHIDFKPQHELEWCIVYLPKGSGLFSIDKMKSLKIEKTTGHIKKFVIECKRFLKNQDDLESYKIKFKEDTFSPFSHNINAKNILKVSRKLDLEKVLKSMLVHDIELYDTSCKSLLCFTIKKTKEPAVWKTSKHKDSYYVNIEEDNIHLNQSMIKYDFKESIDYTGCMELRTDNKLCWNYENSWKKEHHVKRPPEQDIEIKLLSKHLSMEVHVNKNDDLVLKSSHLDSDPFIEGLNEPDVLLTLSPSPDLTIMFYDYKDTTLHLQCKSQHSCNDATFHYDGKSVKSTVNGIIIPPTSSDVINCSVSCAGRKVVTMVNLINRKNTNKQPGNTGGNSGNLGIAIGGSIGATLVAVIIIVMVVRGVTAYRQRRPMKIEFNRDLHRDNLALEGPSNQTTEDMVVVDRTVQYYLTPRPPPKNKPVDTEQHYYDSVNVIGIQRVSFKRKMSDVAIAVSQLTPKEVIYDNIPVEPKTNQPGPVVNRNIKPDRCGPKNKLPAESKKVKNDAHNSGAQANRKQSVKKNQAKQPHEPSIKLALPLRQQPPINKLNTEANMFSPRPDRQMPQNNQNLPRNQDQIRALLLETNALFKQV